MNTEIIFAAFGIGCFALGMVATAVLWVLTRRRMESLNRHDET